MRPVNLRSSLVPVVDPERPGRVTAVIDEAWGVVFAHGGVVMAAMAGAASAVLDRTDLRLVAASSAFCRPVPCGRVEMDVDVLRDGRAGAQVHVRLAAGGDAADGPNAVATAVFARDAGASRGALVRPPGLATPPVGGEVGVDGASRGMPFLEQTAWSPADDQPGEPLRRLVWFRFATPPLEDDGTWDPTALLVPGDALGTALPDDAHGSSTLSSVSLHISAQLHRPARGPWIGIDTSCHQLGEGIVAGTSELWSEDGAHVGTVTQTALLRAG